MIIRPLADRKPNPKLTSEEVRELRSKRLAYASLKAINTWSKLCSPRYVVA